MATKSGGPQDEEQIPAAPGGWEEALLGMERSLAEATQAINLLRGSLEELMPLLHGVVELGTALAGAAAAGRGRAAPASEASTPVAPPPSGATPAAERGRPEPRRLPPRPPIPAKEPEAPPPEPRGLDLLPRFYTITVEDRRGDDRRTKVDLAPLHRALIAMDGVRDLSLVSYASGVAVISLEALSDLASEELEAAVGEAMQRACCVVARDGQRIHMRVEGEPRS